MALTCADTAADPIAVLTGTFTGALRPRGTGHAPGRTAVDLAVMLADGGEAIADHINPAQPAPTETRRLTGLAG